MAIQDELKLFVEKFKLENGRIPTQNEIFKATGRAAKTIKSYLIEGVDYAKPLTKLEAAKLGGKKATGITKVNPLSASLINFPSQNFICSLVKIESSSD